MQPRYRRASPGCNSTGSRSSPDRWRLLRWCERHQVRYIVGIAQNNRLRKQAAMWLAQAQALFDSSSRSQRLFASMHYAARSWDQPRRVIVKAEHNRLGSNCVLS